MFTCGPMHVLSLGVSKMCKDSLINMLLHKSRTADLSKSAQNKNNIYTQNKIQVAH